MNTTYFRTAEAVTSGGLTAENFASGYLSRILSSPLAIYLPLALNYLFGDFFLNLTLINIVFYFLTIWLFYRTVLLVYRDNKTSVISTILFFTNYAVVYFGIRPAGDMSGWFFLIASNYFALKLFYQPANRTFLLLAVLFSSIGILFKEYAVLGMLTLGMVILFGSEKLLSKFLKIIAAAFLFILIPGLYHLIYYFITGYSYLDWYENAANLNHYGFILFIKVMGSLYLFGWFYFIIGLYQEYKNYDAVRARVLLCLVPASFAFLGWPGLLQRVAFVAVPLLAMISGFGLSKIPSRLLIIFLLLIYAVSQFFMKDLLVIVNI
jgi:hypothetical protein